MPKSKRGRKPKYKPVEIGWRSIQIIRTLGVDCTKAAAAAAFYDLEFDPTRPGEKERLLDRSRWTRKTKAKRKSQVTGYSELLKTHCPDFEELRAAVAGDMSPMGVLVWLAATTDAKKRGKKIPAAYRLTDEALSRRKKKKK